MNLIITKANMMPKEDEEINKITIETEKKNPSISIEFFESHPFLKIEKTLSHITYEKRLNDMRISYQRPLTSKSGMDLTFDVSPMGIITNGFIDFYTIKKSSDKRNSFYRLEFNNGSFELYAYTSRKDRFKYPISNYRTQGNLTPETLTVVISRMINIIERYAQKNNKQNIISKCSNFLTINELLSLEKSIVDKIKEIIALGSLKPEGEETLIAFIKEYETRGNDQKERIQEEQLRRIKAKKETSTNN